MDDQDQKSSQPTVDPSTDSGQAGSQTKETQKPEEETKAPKELKVQQTSGPSGSSLGTESSGRTSVTSETSEPSESSEPSQPSESAGPSKPKVVDPNAPKWYVVHTYSGHEAKVAVNLKQRIASQGLDNQILDMLVPTQDKIEIHEGRKETVKEKIFPGYILVKMILNDSTWLAVRSTPGVTSFVGIGDRPTPLPEEEVETIQRFMKMEAPRYKTTFSVGEAVKIVDGPFSEFLGTVSEIDEERGKLKVMVSIFGRETPVELDLLQVAKL